MVCEIFRSFACSQNFNDMTQDEMALMLERAKTFFRVNFFDKNFSKLDEGLSLDDFSINPFLWDYLSLVAGGDTSPLSKAKALIYPRVFGTSITTSFGSNVQKFLTTIGPCEGSIVAGMDIEYTDALDGKKKYAQLKAGKHTINSKDVEPIKREFRTALNLSRTNNLAITSNDLVLGVLYGEGELTPFYASINEEFNVLMGEEFWYHLTGSRTFYRTLITTIRDVAREYAEANGKLQAAVERLALEIENGSAEL